MLGTKLGPPRTQRRSRRRSGFVAPLRCTKSGTCVQLSVFRPSQRFRGEVDLTRVWVNCKMSGIEKSMNICAKQESVQDMLLTFRVVWGDVGGLQD